MSNPFWDYSLAIYGLDGVAPACLALQDRFDVDVNLLLYAAWLAQMDQRLSAGHLSGVETVIIDWRERVIKPLRALRRQLQDYPAAGDVCEELKALELRAEYRQQDMMFNFYQGAAALPRMPRPLRENLLVAVSAKVEAQTCATAIERLIAVLCAVSEG